MMTPSNSEDKGEVRVGLWIYNFRNSKERLEGISDILEVTVHGLFGSYARQSLDAWLRSLHRLVMVASKVSRSK